MHIYRYRYVYVCLSIHYNIHLYLIYMYMVVCVYVELYVGAFVMAMIHIRYVVEGRNFSHDRSPIYRLCLGPRA